MHVGIYVCPTPGCGSYFGSSSMGDLTTQIVGQAGANYEPRPPERWHSRAACPECRSRGTHVERELVDIELVMPEPRVPAEG